MLKTQRVVPCRSVNIGEFQKTDDNSTVKLICSHRDEAFFVALNRVWNCIKVTATLRFDAKTFATPADVTGASNGSGLTRVGRFPRSELAHRVAGVVRRGVSYAVSKNGTRSVSPKRPCRWPANSVNNPKFICCHLRRRC